MSDPVQDFFVEITRYHRYAHENPLIRGVVLDDLLPEISARTSSQKLKSAIAAFIAKHATEARTG